MLYEEYLGTVDNYEKDICDISDYLYDNPELGFEEFKASKKITDFLESQGFKIELGVANIPTAFKATFGVSAPKIGVLAEYDGLSSMSQKGGVEYKESIEGLDKCHGCGHNLFAGGSVGAVLAIKSYIEKTGKGTVTLFGCPAEEGGAGKVFMVRDGVFNGTDAVVSHHPESMYMVRTRPALANVKVNYEFTGLAAHAGANPDKGRSALDALELMNIGANFLREHMPLTARVHYAILDAGGTAPNMVQSHAVVRYLIRDVNGQSVRELKERVDKIAQGAALMTETTVQSKVVSAYSDLITIPTLQAVANDAMHDIPVPIATEEELKFGKAIRRTCVNDFDENEYPFADKVLDPAPPVAHGGSTDTADVSWVCPTVQMHIANWVKNTPGHSWQSASQSRGSYAKKAMLYSAKAVASTAIRLIENPEYVEKAKAEHFEKTKGNYICPMPKDVLPEIKK